MQYSLFIAALFAAAPSLLPAATLRVTVKDPSGAVVREATASLRPAAGGDGPVATTDASGVATFSDVAPGPYQLAVGASGFDTAEQSLDIRNDAAVTVSLKIAAVETTLDVAGGRSALANSEPNYRALRDSAVAGAYPVKNVILKRDCGALTLRSGVVGFLPPVAGRVAIAVFSGDGSFHLDPILDIEKQHIKAVLNREAIDEDFDSAVFFFTDRTLEEITGQNQKIDAPGQLADILKRFRGHMRRRVDIPRSFTEAMLFNDDVPNLEAVLLADLYNPARGATFSAFIRGKKFGDLRFLVKPRGAMPDLPSPEEVGVVNVDSGETNDGIWYLSHTTEELKSGRASSLEVKRTVDAEHYRIETVIGRNTRLAASADVTLKALEDGERVIAFGLLPNLRVSRVTMGGKDVHFIQEPRRADGSFYVVLPEKMAKDQRVTLHIEYEGNKVIANMGSGNFAVGARTSWYPSVNAFQQQATYDLVFRYPKNMTLVSVGKLVSEKKEGDVMVAEWKSDTPMAVAGFNYGMYKKKSITDDATRYGIETYATAEAPDFLRSITSLNLSPQAMAEQAMVDAQNAIRLYTHWFGPAPYGRVAITQQPQFSFGQSWPTLVYLPVSAFLDATERWTLLGTDAFKFGEFIQEVTPHEVAHQWWGHMVGWSSYRDQWLSEGFADFSAGLFLQFTEKKPDRFLQYWDRSRKAILEKNEFGLSANEAGPLWLGFRLNTFKNQSAYRKLVYPKGGYVLHMLRFQMYDPQKGDEPFIEMMQDFVKTNLHKAASLESLVEVMDRHLPPNLDLEGNHSSIWFFRQWVMGTDVPKYRFEYSLAQEGEKWAVIGKVTQSNVPDWFKMRVPLYVEFEGRIIRVGSVPLTGSMTTKEFKILLPKKPKRAMINAYHDILAYESVSKEI